MNISDFRKDLKNQFNEALKAPVLIERGGVMFELTAKGLTGTVITVAVDTERAQFVPTNHNIKVNNDGTLSPRNPAQPAVVANQVALKAAEVPEVGRYVATPEGIFGPTKLVPKTQRFCKNGHPIQNGRDKCFGKGCKYA